MVTDTVYLATEDIVWEALWDQARKLKKRQMEDLEREMGRKKFYRLHLNLSIKYQSVVLVSVFHSQTW